MNALLTFCCETGCWIDWRGRLASVLWSVCSCSTYSIRRDRLLMLHARSVNQCHHPGFLDSWRVMYYALCEPSNMWIIKIRINGKWKILQFERHSIPCELNVGKQPAEYFSQFQYWFAALLNPLADITEDFLIMLDERTWICGAHRVQAVTSQPSSSESWGESKLVQLQ